MTKKESVTVTVTLVQVGTNSGKTQAKCPQCPMVKYGRDAKMAAQLMLGHMIMKHDVDPFAALHVKQV